MVLVREEIWWNGYHTHRVYRVDLPREQVETFHHYDPKTGNMHVLTIIDDED